MIKGTNGRAVALLALASIGVVAGCGSKSGTGRSPDAQSSSDGGVTTPDATAADQGGAPSSMDGPAPVDALTPMDVAPVETRPDGAAGTCVPIAVPACDAPPPNPGPSQAWRHSAPSTLGGGARHRGRDLFIAVGAPQWLIGRFTYGLFDTALTDEDVSIHLLRGCGTTWEKLATARTTDTPPHAAVEGIEDNGGRVFFQVPADKVLGPGRHRVRFVVAGDLSVAELFVEVVAPGTRVFVSDVDGTLTTDENAEFSALLTGSLPSANANAAAALSALAQKGYRPMYLTSRAEALVERTREFLKKEGFPPGILYTTSAGVGANGAASVTYKTAALALLAGKGLKPTYVFGNSDTDAQAYENAAVLPLSNRVFFQYTDAQFKGRRIEAYAEVLPEIAALPNACP